MKHIFLSKRILKSSKKRSRVPSDPSKVVKAPNVEREGSSALSLGALQRNSIASTLKTCCLEKEISPFTRLDKSGSFNKQRKKSFLRHCNSNDFNDSDNLSSSVTSSIDVMTLNSHTQHTQEQEPSSNYDTSASSIYAEECKQDLESIDDFVVSISSLQTKQSEQTTSKKKKRFMDRVRTFLRKSLKLPLDKNHQQWSRFSFDSRMSFDSRR